MCLLLLVWPIYDKHNLEEEEGRKHCPMHTEILFQPERTKVTARKD